MGAIVQQAIDIPSTLDKNRSVVAKTWEPQRTAAQLHTSSQPSQLSVRNQCLAAHLTTVLPDCTRTEEPIVLLRQPKMEQTFGLLGRQTNSLNRFQEGRSDAACNKNS